MPNELKPCPFCGGEADVYEYETEQPYYDPHTLGFLGADIVTRYGSGCTVCGCVIANKASEKEATEAWNRRADNVEKEYPCIYKHTCGFDICTMSECPYYEPKTKGKKWFEEEGADNG